MAYVVWKEIQPLVIGTSDQRVQEKSSSEKKFESPKKLNFFPLKLFPFNIFLVHMDLGVLRIWQPTHFKAFSK